MAGLLAAGAPAQSNQRPFAAFHGVIQGRVLNDQGKPVSGATVIASPEGPWDGRTPVTHTDRNGRFLFRRMPPGAYRLYAFKERKLSQTILAHHFINDPSVLEVTLREHQSIKGLELQLLPRQATLSAQVVGSETGRPVEGARLKLCHLGSAGSCVLDNLSVDGCDECLYLNANRSPGGFLHLAPSNISLTIKVSAPGYEDWCCGNDSNRQEPFVLAPGEIKKLAITLRPTRTTKN
jgi:hypothetical protein